MTNLLLLSTLLLPTPELNPAAQICIDIQPEIEQAVEFELITAEQGQDIIIRCFVNYSMTV